MLLLPLPLLLLEFWLLLLLLLMFLLLLLLTLAGMLLALWAKYSSPSGMVFGYWLEERRVRGWKRYKALLRQVRAMN